MQIDKQLVRERFLKSSASYDRHAKVQDAMARRLAQRLKETLNPDKPLRVLEFGCGTGMLTRYLFENLTVREWIGNDLVDTSLAVREKLSDSANLPSTQFHKCSGMSGSREGEAPAEPRPARPILITPEYRGDLPVRKWVTTRASRLGGYSPQVRLALPEELMKQTTDMQFIEGDMERITIPERVDLIASNAAFQWLADPGPFFKKLAESLAGEGVLAFSTFSPGNLPEIQRTTGMSLPYRSAGVYQAWLAERFETIQIEQSESVLHFPTPVDVLRHFKGTGANALLRRRWTRADLRQFSDDYRRQFSTDEGVSLTFRPLTIIARKKR